MLTSGKYKDGRYVWYEGNKTTPITEFFWDDSWDTSKPGCIYVNYKGWGIDYNCDMVWSYICEW